MKDTAEFMSLEQWLGLSRDEKLRRLFDCKPSRRRIQAQHLWGAGAYGYGDFIHIPSGVAWNEIVSVVFSKNCICSITMEVKREYISQMNLEEFHALLERVNKPGEICHIDPDYADREFRAFCSWRNSNFSGGKEYHFTVEKFDENTLIFQLCTDRGSNGDEDGFGIEPDMWTSALFDLNGNIVCLFRPGIIEPGDEDKQKSETPEI